MAINIDSYEKIDQLQHLNNTPIEEIERRARPDVVATTGFLGKTESLKNVLKADWKVVQGLKTTHIELSDKIYEIWDENEHCESRLYFYRTTPFLKNNSFKPLESFSIKIAAISALITIACAIIFSSLTALIGLIIPVALTILAFTKCQILYVTNNCHKGFQEDIFHPKLWNGWSTELKITNLLNGQSVTIGEGVVGYIKRYGFYEGGGDKNRYRVDPIRLVAILTGASPATVRSKVKSDLK